MGWITKVFVLSLGLAAIAEIAPTSTPVGGGLAEPTADTPATPDASLRQDPRVLAFTEAYEALIDSVTFDDDDAAFHLANGTIRFRDGRLLDASRAPDADVGCDPTFYEYSLAPLTEPPVPSEEMPVYCTDVQEMLWGRDESEIREHGRSVAFLDHKMFVNDLLIEPLAHVEHSIREAARHDPAVAAWMAEIDVTYSFVSRRIAGSPTRSHHGWGLAVDFVPDSYDGRHVYWRWSRALDREGWERIPMEERWSPPQAVVEIFERHGFVWGGKWARFDMIHFEYRPEIILYNRLLAVTDP